MPLSLIGCIFLFTNQCTRINLCVGVSERLLVVKGKLIVLLVNNMHLAVAIK